MLLHDMPDAALLIMVSAQKVYFDKNSLEKNTGRLRNKYKLAGNFLAEIGVYTFFVITTNEHACSNRTTVKVEQCHWENKNQQHLKKQNSYIDAKKIEPLTSYDVVCRIRDTNNGFKSVARLCDGKYIELKSLRSNLGSVGFVSDHRKKIVEQALADIYDISEINDEILGKLGLN